MNGVVQESRRVERLCNEVMNPSGTGGVIHFVYSRNPRPNEPEHNGHWEIAILQPTNVEFIFEHPAHPGAFINFYNQITTRRVGSIDIIVRCGDNVHIRLNMDGVKKVVRRVVGIIY
jgi:hypothetical protein